MDAHFLVTMSCQALVSETACGQFTEVPHALQGRSRDMDDANPLGALLASLSASHPMPAQAGDSQVQCMSLLS